MLGLPNLSILGLRRLGTLYEFGRALVKHEPYAMTSVLAPGGRWRFATLDGRPRWEFDTAGGAARYYQHFFENYDVYNNRMSNLRWSGDVVSWKFSLDCRGWGTGVEEHWEGTWRGTFLAGGDRFIDVCVAVDIEAYEELDQAGAAGA